jgi:hypothetical protein
VGFSIKVAPGVRVRASSRGVRASVGPRAARVHFGAGRPGISTGAGPVSLYYSAGGTRHRTQGGSTRTSAAARERQLRQAARSQQAAELATAFEAIMAVHREEFPIATPPVAPEPPAIDQDAIRKRHEQQALHGIGALQRKARIAARQQAAGAAAAEIAAAVTARAQQYMTLQSWLDEQWHKVLANDPDVVFATLTDAFEDNEAPAAVVSVESGAASIVIMCPDLSVVPDRMPERTSAGNLAFKKLTKTTRNAFCTELVCGRVLATVREALAVAPALGAIHTAVVRPSAPDAYGRHRHECLLAATFTRQALSRIQWQTASAAQIINQAATDQRILQTAYGELQPLNLTSEPELAPLLDAIDRDDPADPGPNATGQPEHERSIPVPTPADAHPSTMNPGSGVPAQPTVPVFLLGGQEDLEVVGESFHQPVLWHLAHANVGDKVRCNIAAVLVPEPDNQHDPNAIAVHIDGQIIGHLPRAIARQYLPGVRHLMTTRGGYAALRGVIVGGGYWADGPGLLGVWLEHDPADFGIRPSPPAHPRRQDIHRPTAPCGLDSPKPGSRTLLTSRTTCPGSAACPKLTGPRSPGSANCWRASMIRSTGISSSPNWKDACIAHATCTSQR